MAETTNLNHEEEVFDPLDMNNYKVEKLPKMQKSGFEKWMARLGGPLAILVFVLIYWIADIGREKGHWQMPKDKLQRQDGYHRSEKKRSKSRELP